MYCSKCGKEIPDLNVACPFCSTRFVYLPQNRENLGALAVLCFFLPLAGLILYLVWGDTDDRRARSASNWAWLGVGFYAIVIIIGFMLYQNFAWRFEDAYNKFYQEPVPAETNSNTNTEKPKSNAWIVENNRDADLNKNWLEIDFNIFARTLKKFYRIRQVSSEMGYGNRSVNPDETNEPYTNAEFMSKEWVADVLGFKRDNFSKNTGRGEYTILSVDRNIVIIKGSNSVMADAKKGFLKATIDVKTGRISYENMPANKKN